MHKAVTQLQCLALQKLFEMLQKKLKRGSAVQLWALLIGVSIASVTAQVASTNTLDYAIIVTGEELLEGKYADAHTQFIARTLQQLGAHCVWSMTVDDRPEDLKQALAFVLKRAGVVIVTGGLGPTANDITRETLSEFTGIQLYEQPELVAQMEKRFGTTADKLRPNLRRQCLVPEQGGWLPNPFGTAAGLIFERHDYVLIALPGPPRELQPMLRDHVVPYLERKYGVRSPRCSLTLRFVGVGQSQIEQTLRDKNIIPADMRVSTQFEGGRVDYTFSLLEDSPLNRSRLKELATRVREVFGENIYAEGTATLEERVLELLKKRGGSVVLVEIGSGGRLAANLIQTGVADDVLKASYVATSDECMRVVLQLPADACKEKEPSASKLKLFAEAAKKHTGAAWAIVVGPPGADADSKEEVIVGSGDLLNDWLTFRVPTQGKGELVQANLVTHILARVRLQLERKK